jgi:hypothetical protein
MSVGEQNRSGLTAVHAELPRIFSIWMPSFKSTWLRLRGSFLSLWVSDF